MEKLGIFGGTWEGRQLAEFCQERGFPAVISVATPYGARLLREDQYLTVHAGRMDGQAMCRWIKENEIRQVIDATHPFAGQASENIREACRALQVSYQRLLREESQYQGKEQGKEQGKDKGRGGGRPSGDSLKGEIFWVGSVEEAAIFLERELACHQERKALLTTGSKELFSFARIKEGADRLYARVLPSPEGLKACREAGILESHIIGMQGPFSYQMNFAILQHTQAFYLVTKESGRPGGFQEKVDAALDLGCQVIVVGRPKREQGKSLAEIKEQLEKEWKGQEKTAGSEKDSRSGSKGESKSDSKGDSKEKRELLLVGMGMGALGSITWEGIEAIRDSDGLLGAARMVKDAMAIWEGEGRKEGLTCITYHPQEMLAWLESHPEVKRPVVLYSGDPGFYSGAASFMEGLKGKGMPYRCRIIPGISTLSYFGARIGKSWEKVKAVSLHGRDGEEDWSLKDQRERFVLLDGTERLRFLCRELIRKGQENALLWVGERLSYPQERLISGKPEIFLDLEFGTLLAAWVIPASL